MAVYYLQTSTDFMCIELHNKLFTLLQEGGEEHADTDTQHAHVF